jgi:hypothetical protein
MKTPAVHDHGGRRSGVDRRQFSYAIHIPERRSGKDRRKNWDSHVPEQKSRSVTPKAIS